jgi:hypothetical protein
MQIGGKHFQFSFAISGKLSIFAERNMKGDMSYDSAMYNKCGTG